MDGGAGQGAGEGWTPRLERLRDELVEDGVDAPEVHDVLAVAELDHARRPPVHENRAPLYGSLVMPAGGDASWCRSVAEVVEMGSVTLAEVRRFADGRSAFVIQVPGRPPALACFERSVQYEADLVGVQAATSATIAQRTTMGTARLFTPVGVIEWTGRSWSLRPNARAHVAALGPSLPEVPAGLLERVLDLCVHWLSPARVGTTIVLHLDGWDGATGLDRTSAVAAPGLGIARRSHFAALLAASSQTDLATLVDPDGDVVALGVGLRPSTVAEQVVEATGGMRHRSARRYTFDHPRTVAFVVSEDGPVSVFSGGEGIGVCSPGTPTADLVGPLAPG